MIVQTYQSLAVLRELKARKTYYAKPSISFAQEYAALIDMMGLNCKCPVFGVIKGRKTKTGGKVSGRVRLTLDVPDKEVKLTEFDEWADFLEMAKYAKPTNYKQLQPSCEEVEGRKYAAVIASLTEQKKPSAYIHPQVVMEKIEPAWLVSSKIINGDSSLVDKLRDIFVSKEIKYKK